MTKTTGTRGSSNVVAILAGVVVLLLCGPGQPVSGAIVTTLDLDGVEYEAPFGNTLLTLDVDAPGLPVGAITWDLTVTTEDYSPSWVGEFRLTLTAPGATPAPGPGAPGNVTLGGSTFSPDPDVMFDGWGSFVGTESDTGSTDLLNGTLAHGTWEVRVWDTLDDGDLNGQITDGWVAVHAVPSPAAASAGLLLLGGLAARRPRRDRAHRNSAAPA